ncbi:hypothetical protein HNQ59_003168 [Chitinivorax tropicus]|uniref:Uncharacterized protein n=1 Tax=Chitinivorax tropicus TaxID=714531 RepID=A0A840MN65_9PROT|nr:hypothetical protein [Chitinivorax tropicus]MBB5019860.1 hypothetical protein [Chitinivorax tropicus]
MRPLYLALGAGFLLCGCSAMSTHSNGLSSDTDQIDHEKIQLVEDYAKRRTMSVHWINYPVRKTTIVQANTKN